MSGQKQQGVKQMEFDYPRENTLALSVYFKDEDGRIVSASVQTSFAAGARGKHLKDSVRIAIAGMARQAAEQLSDRNLAAYSARHAFQRKEP